MSPDSALVATASPSPNFGDRRGRAVDALILHYTGMASGEAARTRLLDPAAQVSAHYLVWEDGRIEQMVAEADRAWHAGRGCWAGEADMNTVSIGIEIVNGGHDFGSPPYPEAQIAAVAALSQDICRRHAIAKARVLAHSDVAPDRKADPGELFPWERLAAGGVGLAVEVPASGDPLDLVGEDLRMVQRRLAAFGYDCPASGVLDQATQSVITAFQRHYRRDLVTGRLDHATLIVLEQISPGPPLCGLRP